MLPVIYVNILSLSPPFQISIFSCCRNSTVVLPQTAVAVQTQCKLFPVSSYFSLFKVFKVASVYSALFVLLSLFFSGFWSGHIPYMQECVFTANWGTAWLVVTSSLLDCITSEGEKKRASKRVVFFFFLVRWIRSERGSRMSWRRVCHQSKWNESVSLSNQSVGHCFHGGLWEMNLTVFLLLGLSACWTGLGRCLC